MSDASLEPAGLTVPGPSDADSEHVPSPPIVPTPSDSNRSSIQPALPIATASTAEETTIRPKTVAEAVSGPTPGCRRALSKGPPGDVPINRYGLPERGPARSDNPPGPMAEPTPPLSVEVEGVDGVLAGVVVVVGAAAGDGVGLEEPAHRWHVEAHAHEHDASEVVGLGAAWRPASRSEDWSLIGGCRIRWPRR